MTPHGPPENEQPEQQATTLGRRRRRRRHICTDPPPTARLNPSSSVQHLSGVLFGLLSSLSAGGAYVIIKFLGTAKAERTTGWGRGKDISFSRKEISGRVPDRLFFGKVFIHLRRFCCDLPCTLEQGGDPNGGDDGKKTHPTWTGWLVHCLERPRTTCAHSRDQLFDVTC